MTSDASCNEASCNESESRTATNRLLADLSERRCTPGAWGTFFGRAASRSARQAQLRPRALAETTALHVIFATLADRPGRRWVIVSWALTATHLGMLGVRRTLGAANAVTLFRANLPAIGGLLGRWGGAVALGTDLADGRLARASGTCTSFGAAADSLADAAFWAWFTTRYETDAAVRVFALALWTVPVLAFTAASIGRGQMIDPPRPRILRPAAAMQAVISVRALTSRPQSTRRRPRVPVR